MAGKEGVSLQYTAVKVPYHNNSNNNNTLLRSDPRTSSMNERMNDRDRWRDEWRLPRRRESPTQQDGRAFYFYTGA